MAESEEVARARELSAHVWGGPSLRPRERHGLRAAERTSPIDDELHFDGWIDDGHVARCRTLDELERRAV
jgi:hypothetical protein